MRVSLILFQKPILFILFRLLTVLVSSHTYIIYKTTSCTTSSFVYLKSFKELSFFRAPVSAGKRLQRRFFFPSKFSEVFSKKFFRRTHRGLSFSRSLASLQGKILRCSAFSKSASLYQSVIFSGSPLESGCKGTHFFRFCNFYAILFAEILKNFCKSL